MVLEQVSYYSSLVKQTDIPVLTLLVLLVAQKSNTALLSIRRNVLFCGFRSLV